MIMERKKLIGIDINLGDYSSFVDNIIERACSPTHSGYICVANVHMLIEAHQSPAFAEIVNGSYLATPDGVPLRWAFKFLYGIDQERIAGMDLLSDLLFAAEKQKVPVAFYGGKSEMLGKAKLYLEKTYPDLIIGHMYSPPFRALSSEEENEVVRNINDSGARLVFVILGCPKQEKWMASMQNRIQAVMIGIGGALPVLAGVYKRAPGWMQHAGLEWLFRLGQEPKRLFKRYATTNSMFVYLLLKEKLKRGKHTYVSGRTME
jgi:N-acetylglucosaminyldiphosphoundecaprenol N-acetyl-beta-D-mannosaminyltransferase